MVSNNFINECKNRANKNRLGKIFVDGIDEPITNSNNLQSIEIDSGCYVDGNIIGSVYAKCLKANFIAEQNNLSDKSIQAQIGVKYADLSTEYINVGQYKVERPNNEITANMSQITAYSDLYTNLDKKYVCNLNYDKGNVTLEDLYIDVCSQLQLIPVSTSFVNSTIPISNNPFTNGEKNRTVLQTIAKISSSFIDINNDENKIDLCWLSQNEKPDYIFYKNDYIKVDGGQVVCGPINCLIIKNSQLDDENVTIKDDESIAMYGEHSIIISEDYILYNSELREQAISNIWNRVKGMKYVDCKLTTYYGKPFLKLGDKIRIYTSETEYFDTYVLKHKFTYDGAFTSVIESPALTKQEIKTKQDISLGQSLRNTQIKIDKQNQKISSVINKVDDQNNKIANITQTVDELNSKISDVANLTTEKESTFAKVELENINKSEPIMIKIYPTTESISDLLISSNMLISDEFKLKQRLIRFENTKTGKIIDYKLPNDLLIYDSNIYDEFYLDYDSHTCQITKRCEYKEDGTVSKLNKEEIINYSYPKIELDDGDYIVSLLGYDNGYLVVRLMNSNLYTFQFYTKSEVNSEISQKADEINESVNQKLSNYSTTIEMNAVINVKANEINSSVSGTYITKNDSAINISKAKDDAISISNSATDKKLENYSTTIEMNNAITQKVSDVENELSLEVSKKVNNTEYTHAKIVEKINDDTSSILIEADKVDIKANDIINILAGNTINLTSKNIVISSTNLSIDKNGILKCSNGEFSGKIISTSGNIGGWNIQSSAIDYETSDYKVTITNGTNTNKDFLVVYDKKNNNYPFFARADGYLHVTKGDIAGGIIGTGINASYLTTGSISSCNINIYNGSGFIKMLSGQAYNPYVSALNVARGSGGIVFRDSGDRNNVGNNAGQIYEYNNVIYLSASNGTNVANYLKCGNIGISGVQIAGASDTYIRLNYSVVLKPNSNGGAYIWGTEDYNKILTVGGSPSTLSVKERVEEKDTSDILDIIKEIKLYDYKYIDEIEKGKEDYGYIIDYIEKIPNIKKYLTFYESERNGIKFKQLAHEQISKFLLGAVIELEKKIERLEEQVNVN